jgi:hypothetical protein
MAKSTEQDISYFDGLSGAGLETIDKNAVATAYLSIVQPDSTMVTEDCPPGSWKNSATGECYGPEVKVVVLAFQTVWTERDSEPPYLTVGRYPPNSILVDVTRPKNGKRGFPTMINPDTGNKIQELFVYACMLPDHPEAGVVYLSPGPSSMRACKRWNSMLISQRLPNDKGELAPIYGYTWNISLALVANPSQPNRQLAQMSGILRGPLVDKQLFIEQVKPGVDATKQLNLLEAPQEVEED